MRGRPPRRVRRHAGGAPDTQPGLSAHVLALPALDHLFGRLLAHPRMLQVASILLGIAVVGLTLRPLLSLGAGHTPTRAPAVATTTPSAQPGTPEQDTIALVAAYNQASIAAAVLGRADALAPYLTPDGRAWAEAQAEYQRRAARGESHEPALTRWGVLRATVEDGSATVETQEQWDDRVSIDGQIVSSRRGIVTRNVYTLRRAPDTGGWLIAAVATDMVIG